MSGSILASPPIRRAARIGSVAGLVLVALVATAGPAVAASGVAWPTQSRGDRGTDVLTIQHLLRGRLAAEPVPAVALPPADGQFRSSTDAAVRAFQSAHGLAPDGVVAWATWGRLIQRLGRGASGEAVRALQVELVEKVGAAISVSGSFGAATEAALITFQRHMGLPRTGVVDTATWRALAWHFELPRFAATSLCDYSAGNGPANWGTAEAIATTEAVGRTVFALGFGRVAVGDVSFEHGGPLPGHDTHRFGLDVDVRPLRWANDQCAVAGTTWRSTAYDRAATRTMILKFRVYAVGHIELIYFNDPILIGEGLTTWHTGHDDHVHVRFCETTHPLSTYDC
ncbi:MAG TPA: penicillin-insensitive murein endopeptidase [Candidatus Limnocylindrales bacterium]|nr:penicillin-insensitive murein endopeptidase [Candidatus Limnocylindrales bacterium]